MAPHLQLNPLGSKVPQCEENTFKSENTFKNGKRPRLMTCSSVNYSEEEETKVNYFDQSEYFRSSTLAKKPWRDSNSSFRMPEIWPGVSPLLDEGDKEQILEQKKTEKIVLETEDKKRAVENDDQTTGLFESTALKSTTQDKNVDFSFEDKIHGMKAKLGWLEEDLLVISFPIQESSVALVAETVLLVTEDCQAEEPLTLKEESESGDELAQVQINEDVKIHTVPPKRHVVKRLKRNCYEVTDPDPPSKKKKACRAACPKKTKKAKTAPVKKALPSCEEIDKIIAQFTEMDELLKTTQPEHTGMKRPDNPVSSEPKDSTDSGVHSQSESSGSAGDEGSSGGSGGSSSGEGGSGDNSGRDNGDDDEDDDSRDKKGKSPWWCLPGGENIATKVKKKKRDREEEKTEGSEEKMEVDVTSFQFLPSKVDHPEQCHHAGKDELMNSDVLTENRMVDFSPQDLQHACYCSSAACHNQKCKLVKEDVKHMETHKKWLTCTCCKSIREIVKQHARFCKRKGCRVPDCDQIRKSSDGSMAKPSPSFLGQIPAVAPTSVLWATTRTPIVTKPRIDPIDGRVIFRNSPCLPELYFSEHIDYHVQRNNKVGGGTNGDIYKMFVAQDRSVDWVVKETKYPIPLEEIEVYKALGYHEHIVHHFGAAFRGSDGKASIFMEKCDQSLFDYMEAKNSRLSVDEAMFYGLQVLDGVVYMHNRPVPVINKDIKAKNVMLTSEYSRAKIADWDSAKLLHDELTEAGLKPLGTKGFAAPEVLEKQPHGRPADIYSFGCLLLEMTVGVPSFKTLHDKIEQLRQLHPDLADVVKKCTMTSPKDRPTARELVEWSIVKGFKNLQRTE